jgi:hypothetical protein
MAEARLVLGMRPVMEVVLACLKTNTDVMALYGTCSATREAVRRVLGGPPPIYADRFTRALPVSALNFLVFLRDRGSGGTMAPELMSRRLRHVTDKLLACPDGALSDMDVRTLRDEIGVYLWYDWRNWRDKYLS